MKHLASKGRFSWFAGVSQLLPSATAPSDWGYRCLQWIMLPVRVPQLLLRYPFVTRKFRDLRESYSSPPPTIPDKDDTLLYFTTSFFCHPWNSLLPRSLHLPVSRKIPKQFYFNGQVNGLNPIQLVIELNFKKHLHSILRNWSRWTSLESFDHLFHLVNFRRQSFSTYCHGNFRQPWHGLLQWCGQYSPAASRCSDLTGRADDRDGVRSCRADWWLSRAWQVWWKHWWMHVFHRCFCWREWLRIGKLVLKSLDACWYNDEH